jgi:hypothetical protein
MCYLATISEWFNNERFLGHHNSEWVAGAAIILIIVVSAWFLCKLWKTGHKRWFWVVLSILLSVLTGGLLPILLLYLLLPLGFLWLCVRIVRHAWKG